VRSAFKQVVADLQDGVDFYTAFANLQKTIPSRLLARVVAVLEEQRITDGNLGMILEPLSEQFVQEVGSDPASHEAMRRCAEQLGAPLPERAK
jgi:Flp pilus assembly protein TadB